MNATDKKAPPKICWGVWNRSYLSLRGPDAAEELFESLVECFTYVGEQLESGQVEAEYEVGRARVLTNGLGIPVGDAYQTISIDARGFEGVEEGE